MVAHAMKPRPATEAELAAVVITWLEALGAEVWQEVECGTGVADIVARLGAELWIIETKLSLSLALLVQACERRREAHRVYCAAPYTRTMREFGMLCEELGVGLLDVRVGEASCDSGSGWGMPSARSSMLHWIETGRVEGVSVARGAQTTLHPTGTPAR